MQVDEKSTVNEIMYARGSPRVRGARGFNFCAKMLAQWERGREREGEKDRDGIPAFPQLRAKSRLYCRGRADR